MQSFGIKNERIDRDLLCIYESAGQRAYMLALCDTSWTSVTKRTVHDRCTHNRAND